VTTVLNLGVGLRVDPFVGRPLIPPRRLVGHTIRRITFDQLMSRLVSRILLSILMFPLAGMVYVVAFVVGESASRNVGVYRGSETELFAGSGAVTWLFVGVYWCLLWRHSIRWSSRRVIGTILSAVGAAVVGIVIGVFTAVVVSVGDGSFGAFVGGVVAILLWLIATVFLWRETVIERASRISSSSRSAITCPTCGYNLTGLSEARCPECGSKFTLDELIALQSRIEVEIE
jgi:Zn finger protein HypA/HybF involved in hydrogenase expression